MSGDSNRAELFELYKIAIDEYRFQVNLNWQRTQYYLALNVGIVGIATGILQLAKGDIVLLVAGIYLAGALCCGLALAASRTQKTYYEATREHKADIERKLELNELSISTTRGMGNTIDRLGKVTTLINVMLVLLGLMNLAGVAVVVF